MNEHDDDIEPEVDEGAEFETEEFPILSDEDDVDEVEGVDGDLEADVDPDESEI